MNRDKIQIHLETIQELLVDLNDYFETKATSWQDYEKKALIGVMNGCANRIDVLMHDLQEVRKNESRIHEV